MKSYPSYKDSGVEWIGEIPSHWETVKLKRLTKVKRGASPRPIDDPKYFDEEGKYSWVRIADVTASERYLKETKEVLSELGSSLSVKIEPGDLFLSIAGSVGKPIITLIKCCIHDGFVYFPDLQINNEFLFYIFLSGQPFLGLGKWGTQLNLNTETVGEITIPFPSDKEIEDVVNFLDQKTAEIDLAVKKGEERIRLLKEYRAAMIHEAVTRGVPAGIGGIGQGVEMKESGIEYIGEIPKHWEVKKLKYLGKIKYGLGQPPKQKEGGLPLIRATNIKRGKISDLNMVFVDEEDVPYERDPVLKENDIIVVRSGAYTADSAIIPEKYAGAIAGYDMVFRPQKINPQFIAYGLLSDYILVDQLYLNRMRAAQPHLNAEELGGTIILVPPIEEQRQIVEYIETETARLDAEIRIAEEEIRLLQEYREALISEAVTGKIDVRDYLLN